MTQRIAISILITAWTILIVSGVVAYTVTRTVLLDNLDNQILARAATLPEINNAGQTQAVTVEPDDRYLIQNELGQTISRPISRSINSTSPVTVINRHFSSLADGHRARTFTLQILPTAENAKPLLVIYSGSAAQLDQVLDKLAIAMVIGGVLAGGLAAAAAVWMARISIRPLHYAADVMGTIDEDRLDWRVDRFMLPRELEGIALKLNEMLARFQRSAIRNQRIIAKASREVQTSLSAIISKLEITTYTPETTVDLQQSMRGCLADLTGLRTSIGLIDHQIRTGTAVLTDEVERCDLIALLKKCSSAAARVAMGKGMRMTHVLPDELYIETSPRIVQITFADLFRFAVDVSIDDGNVQLSCEANGQIVITVKVAALKNLAAPRSDRNMPIGIDESLQTQMSFIITKRNVEALGGSLQLEIEREKTLILRVTLPEKLIIKREINNNFVFASPM